MIVDPDKAVLRTLELFAIILWALEFWIFLDPPPDHAGALLALWCVGIPAGVASVTSVAIEMMLRRLP
jgi:hypothetical protein